MDAKFTLREYDSLQYFNKKISQKSRGPAQREWTCLDVSKKYIVTACNNSDTIYVFNRVTQDVQKLKHSLENAVVIRIYEGIDTVIAVGRNTGNLSLFQLPSVLPEHPKQMQALVINGLHTSPIRCLEWSVNGMKLFSADSSGLVVVTELDYQHDRTTSKSYVLLKEAEAAVQLSYMNKMLLVSTAARCILHFVDDGRTVQIGNKDKKVSGSFGGILSPSNQTVVAYIARPGLRMWRANVNGTVEATYLFKEFLVKTNENIVFLNEFVSSSSVGDSPKSTPQFGLLHTFANNYLVTYRTSALFVVDPREGALIAYHTKVGSIRSIAVCDDEIFILQDAEGLNVLRIGLRRDPYLPVQPIPVSVPSQGGASTSIGSVVTLAASRMQHGLASTIQSISTHLQQVPEGYRLTKMSPMSHSRQKLDDDVDVGRDATTLSPSSEQCLPVSAVVPKAVAEAPSPGSDKQEAVAVAIADGQDTGSVTSSTDIVSQAVLRQRDNDDDEFKVVQVKKTSKNKGSGRSSSSSSIASETKSPEPQRVQQPNSQQLDINSGDLSSNHAVGVGQVAAKTGFVHLLDSESRDPSLLSRGEVSISTVNKRRASKERYADVKMQHLNVSDDSQGNCSDNTSPLGAKTRVQSVIVDKCSSAPQHSACVDTTSIVRGLPAPQITADDKFDVADGCNNEPLITDAVFQDSDPLAADLHLSIDTAALQATSAAIDGDAMISDPLTAEQTCVVFQPMLESGVEVLKLREIEIATRNGIPAQSIVLNETEVALSSVDWTGTSVEVVADKNYINDPPTGIIGSVVAHGVDDTSQQLHIDSTEDTARSDTLDELLASYDVQDLPAEDSVISLNASCTAAEAVHQSATVSLQPPLERYCEAAATFEECFVDNEAIERSALVREDSADDTQSDDFYGKYRDEVVVAATFTADRLHNAAAAAANTIRHPLQSSSDDPITFLDHQLQQQLAPSPREHRAADWTNGNRAFEIGCPSHLRCLSVSSVCTWCTDSSSRLWYLPAHDVTMTTAASRWRRISASAHQVSASPSGNILWRLWKGSVFVACKVTVKQPYGQKWEEIARKASHIAVDEHMAWYIKDDGRLIVHKGLSKDHPWRTAVTVDCTERVVQLSCHQGVTWALTERRDIIARVGISHGAEEGTRWKSIASPRGGNVGVVALGDGGTAWAVDGDGQLWCMPGLTDDNPCGSGIWYQVPLCSSDVVLLSEAGDIVVSNSKSCVSSRQSVRKNIIVPCSSGVWTRIEGQGDLLRIYAGPMIGETWTNGTPVGIASSTKWRLLCARSASSTRGFIWAQQPSGVIVAFSPSGSEAMEVALLSDQVACMCLTTCQHAVWCLLVDGRMFVRAGVSVARPTGSHWLAVDLQQLGDVQLIKLSAGAQYLWGVDSGGDVYMCLITGPSSHVHGGLTQAWLPVDGCTCVTGAKFTSVVSAPDDSMVWALDNRQNVYIRRGITDHLPVGTHWVTVPGMQMEQLVVSKRHMYGVNTRGDVWVRCGINDSLPAGDRWKLLAVSCRLLSVTTDDRLWCVDQDGSLRCHTLHNVTCSPLPLNNPIDDWELI